MSILPVNKQEWFALLLFPFKTYLVIAPVCLCIWAIANANNHVRGATAEATGRVLFGYFACTCVFLVTAVIQWFTGRHAAALENILFAAIAFFIAYLLAPMSATA
jgi:cobalamin biosynthesis protein CobD/CbiB